MGFKVAVIGLPGSGKTTFCRHLSQLLVGAEHINADAVRAEANDWDFSEVGRLRQAKRMRERAEAVEGIALVDFICPTPTTRKEFGADMVIFMDTIKESRFPDTDKVFVPPKNPDVVVGGWEYGEAGLWNVAKTIQMLRPQGAMIGRYQPFHDGHKALFREILGKHGFVTVLVRQMPLNEKNPLAIRDVIENIQAALQPEFAGQFAICPVPNVAGVYYGRDVGYAVEKIELPDNVTSISATAIRKERGIVHED